MRTETPAHQPPLRQDPEITPGLRVNWGEITASIVGGHEHGVELTRGSDAAPVTRPMCMNLEHYLSSSCSGGIYVPRYKAPVRTELLDQRVLRVTIEPLEPWRICTTISFQALPDCVIEAWYEFSFEQDFKHFEALVSNYFIEPTEPYLHLAGRWLQPHLSDREHRLWARDAAVGAMVPPVFQSGRSEEERARMDLPLDPVFYDYPIIVSPARDGWSVINIIEPEGCCVLSANTAYHAHDFCLVGRDVVAGETVSFRAWLVYAHLNSPGEAIDWYEELLGKRAGAADERAAGRQRK